MNNLTTLIDPPEEYTVQLCQQKGPKYLLSEVCDKTLVVKVDPGAAVPKLGEYWRVLAIEEFHGVVFCKPLQKFSSVH